MTITVGQEEISAGKLSPVHLQQAVEAIRREGYVVLEDIISDYRTTAGVLTGAVERIVTVSLPGPRSIIVATPPAVESTFIVSLPEPSAMFRVSRPE